MAGDILTKDEFRIEWSLDGNVVGVSPTVWQKPETAESHAQLHLRELRDEMGIDLGVRLTYRVQARYYNVSKTGWQ